MSYNGRDFWSASVALTPAAGKYHSPAAVTSPYENSPLELTIFVSCYNESSTILSTLDTVIEAMHIVGLSYEIIIVDDCSNDGSFNKIRQYIADKEELNIVLRGNQQNKGLAQNYLDAAFIGCGKYFCMIHGDNAEPAEALADILRATGEADIILPYDISALVRGLMYEVIAGSVNRLVNVVSGHRINDYTGLQIHLRYNVMRWHPGTRRNGFQVVMLCQLLDLGFTCRQVPFRSVVLRHADVLSASRNVLSSARTIVDVLLRRLSNKIGW